MVAPPVTPDTSLIGDNSEAFEKLFNDALRLQISLNNERSALNAKISNARKGMKADGLELGHLDKTIAMMEWSPAEVREDFAIRERYARLARLPIGTHIDLLADASEEEVSAEDWKSRGYAAGVTGMGVPGVPPDNCPPENHQHWLAGWNDSMWTNAPHKLVEKARNFEG